MATYVRIHDNLKSGKYYQSAYTVIPPVADCGWVEYSKHGYVFAACVGVSNFYNWYWFTYKCEGGYKYTFDINTYGLNDETVYDPVLDKTYYQFYDGVLILEEQIEFDPDEYKQFINFTGGAKPKYFVCSGHAVPNGFNCSVSGSGTYEYNPTSDKEITIVFRKLRSENNYANYAAIKITRFINVNVRGNGGTINGKDNISLYMEPYKSYPGVLDSVLENPVVSRYSTTGVNWVSVSGIYESNIVGSSNYGTMVINSSGKFVGGSTEAENNKLLATDASDIGLYLHWKDACDSGIFVSGPVSTYCTSAPMISTTTSNEIELLITNSNYKGVKFASGPVNDYYCNLSYGFKIDSDSNGNGAYLTVPSGLSAGKYDLGTVTFSSPDSSYLTYERVSVSRKLPVINVSSVALSSNNISNTAITQRTDIPASGIIINTISGVKNYYNVNPIQKFIYTNGASKNGTVSCVLSGSINVSSRGKIYDANRKTHSISGVYVTMSGEDSKTSTVNITQAIQQANTIQDVFVYTSPSTNQITVNESLELFAAARYTSGEIRDLVSEEIEQNVSFSVVVPSFLVLNFVS